jgi:N-acetylglucosaminyldiphosphoundecaprenol N-acetyl-beta-D-mannosaminyltransferase
MVSEDRPAADAPMPSAGSRPSAPALRSVPRPLFGFDFIGNQDMASIVEQVLGPQPDDDRLPFVVTPNVDYIVRLREPALADLAEALPRARYILPDGQPIVWTSRLLKPSLKSRLPGSSMFPVIWKRIVADQRRTMIVAANEATADLLRQELPDVGVVVPPHFDAAVAAELDAVVGQCLETMRATQPEFVFLGISFPKQQRVAMALVDELRRSGEPMPVFLLLGGSFEMYLGTTKRAPTWMQRVGLEWFFRFLMEPKRLFRRYFVTDTRFVWLLARELVAAKFPPAAKP